MKTTLVLTEANREYLETHAIGEKGISRLLNDIVQAHRTLGPVHERIERQVDRLSVFNKMIADQVGSGA
jgi:hypothetical protein